MFYDLLAGCVGGVCALANVLGEACCELQQLVVSGKLDEAKRLQHRLIAPNGAVSGGMLGKSKIATSKMIELFFWIPLF